jgi:hypothetical protein
MLLALLFLTYKLLGKSLYLSFLIFYSVWILPRSSAATSALLKRLDFLLPRKEALLELVEPFLEYDDDDDSYESR